MFGFIRKFFAAERSNLSNPARWFTNWLNRTESDSGITMTGESAISFPPVWYAINKLAGHVGILPLNLHKSLERGSEKAWGHPCYRLMRTRPNSYQTAIVFKEQMMAHALLWGNGRAAIIRDGNQRPIELLPLLPDRTATVMEDGIKFHVTALNANERIGEYGARFFREQDTYVIPDRDVLHVPGLGFNGLGGLSLIQVAKNSWGLGLAAEKAANKDFATGSKPGLLLQAPAGVFRDEEDAKKFMENFNRYHSGLDNAGRAGLLREGITAQPLSMSRSDAQWIEQRRFQRQEAALWFLLEQILGDDSSVSYNSLEQKNLAYLSNSLSRWLVKWEQECDEKLLSSAEKAKDSHYFRFNVASILRTDIKTTIETLGIGVTHKIYSPNEAREKLDLNPYEGGDKYENPAITVASPASRQQTEDNRDTAARAAIVSRLQHMIGVECNRVRQAVKNEKNFLNWLDRFYDKFTSTMSSVFVELGIPDQSTEHCEESKNRLLTVADKPSDQFAAAIEDELATWLLRAEKITDSVFQPSEVL